MFGNHRQNACMSHATVFTTRRYASAVYAVVACPFVRTASVRLSLKWLNVGRLSLSVVNKHICICCQESTTTVTY